MFGIIGTRDTHHSTQVNVRIPEDARADLEEKMGFRVGEIARAALFKALMMPTNDTAACIKEGKECEAKYREAKHKDAKHRNAERSMENKD